MGAVERGGSDSPTVWIIPVLHPARIERGAWNLEPPQMRYVERAVEQARDGREPGEWGTTPVPPRPTLAPTLDQLERWVADVATRSDGALSIDLETVNDEILCIGVLPFAVDPFVPGVGMCIRFRRRLGVRYWRSWDEHCRAVALTNDLLATPLPKVFHNGIAHDVPILRVHGFDVAPPYWDTMSLMHDAYTELPRGLQFTATLTVEAPLWKAMVDEGEDDDG